ncbi:UNVERIFIED_CONTAM: Cysteine proteinase inhibitor 12 [Sesamum calycinum]|uniref:Cysteine proteinase inhibitor n=1 Tax=Sesamum calycinum TaxID=2727403 RepID=A0AAW2L7D2_9LAMI
MRALPFSIFLILSAALLSSFVLPQHNLGLCPDNVNQVLHMATLGGVHDSHSIPNPDTHSLARFAVDQHNTKEQKKLYEAKVWVKPWMDFKQLQEFKHVRDVPSLPPQTWVLRQTVTRANQENCLMVVGHVEIVLMTLPQALVVIHGGDDQVSGWRPVPVHDPVVQDAAHHAIKTIQERSNSLFPYELSEVVDASAKFDMLLKVKRGGKEEKYKVEVHKDTEEGSFDLKKLDRDHS